MRASHLPDRGCNRSRFFARQWWIRWLRSPHRVIPARTWGQNLAMMGVGAAGLAAGLLIGGDGGNAIAIVGAVVGLLGLYRYMR